VSRAFLQVSIPIHSHWRHCPDAPVGGQARIEAPAKVRENLRIFLDKLDPNKDLKQLNLGDLTVAKVVEELTAIFQM
jgi:hypothetical protein